MRGIKAGVRLRHAEAGSIAAGNERRQPAFFLGVAAEYDDRVEAEDVHMHGGGARHAGAGRGDGLHHDRRLDDTEPGAAVLRRHRNPEPAIAREGGMKFVGETPCAVLLQPVIKVELGAHLGDRGADGFLLGYKSDCDHDVSSNVQPQARGARA